MKQLVFVFLLLLMVGCGDMGSGYTQDQITAIQQGTPVAAVLTAFPVTYAPARPMPVDAGVGGSAAANAHATIIAVTRAAADAASIRAEATQGAIDATRVSVSLTQDAAAFQAQQDAVSIDLTTKAQLAALEIALAEQSINATVQAMSDQAIIDAADVRSAERQLYWFEQVQQAEAEKALSQAKFYAVGRYGLAIVVVSLLFGFGYWWLVMRPQQEVKVVKVDGRDVLVVKTPQGYAPVVTRMQTSLPDTSDAAGQLAGAIPDTLPPVVELPEVEDNILQVGIFETGAPIHLGMGFKGILVTGEPGSGKSTFLRQLVAQALQHGWLIYLADGEQITFQPHLWGPVAKSQAEIGEWLSWLKGDIIEARHELFRRVADEIERRLPAGQQFLIEDLSSYNRAAAITGIPLMSPMLIGWDEANKALSDKGVQTRFDDLAQSARKVGAELIISGHDWRAAQVPKGSSSYLPWRVAFRSEKTSSEVVLRGSAAAMHIPYDRPGLAYTLMREWRGYTQGYFVPDARLIQMVRQMRPRYSLPESSPWSGYTVTHNRPTALPSEVDMTDLIQQSQAEADAEQLLNVVNTGGMLRSRRQVAMRVAGNDNPEGYERGDDALQVLVDRGHRWADDLLNSDARYTTNYAAA